MTNRLWSSKAAVLVLIFKSAKYSFKKLLAICIYSLINYLSWRSNNNQFQKIIQFYKQIIKTIKIYYCSIRNIITVIINSIWCYIDGLNLSVYFMTLFICMGVFEVDDRRKTSFIIIYLSIKKFKKFWF